MALPTMLYGDGLQKSSQSGFGGLNHTPGAADGEIWDMKNLTSDYAPLLATRPKRFLYATINEPGGIFGWHKLAWVSGDGFYYDGVRRGTVTTGEKTMVSLGAYILIFPDKAYYNTADESFASLESKWEGTSLTFTNGIAFEEEGEANTIQADGVDWEDYFKAGDAVTISGCTKHPENNKTPIIREIDGDKLYFYEYVFMLDGEEGTTPYTETGELQLARTVPDLDFLCENENRVWGCKGNSVYCCKLGDPFNWNDFDTPGTAAWAVDCGSAGEFTGCISYMGYPVFFKENNIYKVYGTISSNFQLMGSATLGVAQGSAKSLAVAGEVLFYLSRSGIMAYQGGVPQSVGLPLGLERYKNAVGGSDGLKYYVSMETEAGGRRLFVYDTQRGMWHAEDDFAALNFVLQGDLYGLNEAGEIWMMGRPGDIETAQGEETTVAWSAEFADETFASPDKKGITKLQIRLELAEGASVDAFLRYDSIGEWQKVATLPAGEKRSYVLPVVPRRADHFRLRLSGAGQCLVYSISREVYSGSELKSIAGRN